MSSEYPRRLSNSEQQTIHFHVEPDDVQRMVNFCGEHDSNIRQIADYYQVTIKNRGNQFCITGTVDKLPLAQEGIHRLYAKTLRQQPLSPEQIQIQLVDTFLPSTMTTPQHINQSPQATVTTSMSEQPISNQTASANSLNSDAPPVSTIVLKTRKLSVQPRGVNQVRYVNSIHQSDICFGIGPAGTGKTFLAIACAVHALLEKRVEKIILVRPAVEAGEKLGFLPGDMAQKIDPYLRPLYDAMYVMLGVEYTEALVERNIVEVAPLAFMRGRTLTNAFIIFDESQNSTTAQMKMLLTRIGFGSTVVVTGDTTQIDLTPGVESGLIHVQSILKAVKGVSFCYLEAIDIIRHPVVQRVVDAYQNQQTAPPPT